MDMEIIMRRSSPSKKESVMPGKFPKVIRGSNVQDAEDALTLNIGPGDIKGAISLDPHNCAAAKAAKRQLKVVDVCVMRSKTYINYGSRKDPNWVRYSTPASLSREIIAIDRGGRFEPGTYRLPPVCPSARLGSARAITRNRSERKGERHNIHITAKIREV